MLPLIIILAIIGIIILVIGSVVLWLTGLITAFIFFVVAIMLLYALHEMDALNVERDRWLLIFPFFAFVLGLGLDKIGVLTVKPLQLANLDLFGLTVNLNVSMWVLIIIVALLIVDIVVSVQKE